MRPRHRRRRPRLLTVWLRTLTHLLAAGAGAALVALAGRGNRSARPAPVIGAAPSSGSAATSTAPPHPAPLHAAGWAELLDGSGVVLARGRVMLAIGRGAPPAGELRSLHRVADAPALTPGRYRVRFEAGHEVYEVEVLPALGTHAEVAAIRWEDVELPASLRELGEA
ncbi:MAG: hypothetical protein WD734_06920 [Dehalococcoidia bacterium]